MNHELKTAYQAIKEPAIQLGSILLANQLLEDAPVKLSLASLNRHGLIAGATGSGKTKTMQVLAEQLSLAGVPSLVMDIKGDVSGLAAAGSANEKLVARNKSLDLDYNPRAFNSELFTLNENTAGIVLRSTVQDFGALLFSRMLDLNDTQAGVTTILFEFAAEENIPLITLADFTSLLQFMQSDNGKKATEAKFGSVASSTMSTILRKIIELKAQGGEFIFGEPAFNIHDFINTNSNNEGMISILRLMALQETPDLFSTFMIKLLSDLYKQLPEVGDPEKPVLVLFIDEAHLIFANASKTLLNLMTTMVKLIRSKGVGLIFCTQTPDDIPSSVLSQLGLKIQHVLRAFTAKDRQAMRLVAKNFPLSTDYNVEELLTSMSIGEALVCALDDKAQPTPLIECMVRAPLSRMGTLSDNEVNAIIANSNLLKKYQQTAVTPTAANALQRFNQSDNRKSDHQPATVKKSEKAADNILSTLSKNTLVRQVTRQIFRSLMQNLIKMFSGKKSR